MATTGNNFFLGVPFVRFVTSIFADLFLAGNFSARLLFDGCDLFLIAVWIFFMLTGLWLGAT